MSAWSFDGCVCKLNAAIKNGGFNRIVWLFVLIPVSTAYMGYLRIDNSKPDDISGSQNRIRKVISTNVECSSNENFIWTLKINLERFIRNGNHFLPKEVRVIVTYLRNNTTNFRSWDNCVWLAFLCVSLKVKMSINFFILHHNEVSSDFKSKWIKGKMPNFIE